MNYNWKKIWVSAGQVTFSANLESYMGRTAWHFTGNGTTFSKYDWIYKVRDKYESYCDTSSLKPLRFLRDVHEGGNYYYDDHVFSYTKKRIYSTMQKGKKLVKDSVAIAPCTYDVMTAVYAARGIDFSLHKYNDTIPLVLMLENKIYKVHIRFIGREEKKVEGLGTFKCIKFKPLLIEGTLFKGGEEMTVWVSDDKNKVPVYIETPILVGWIKVNLRSYKNLKYPLSSMVKLN
ncbi:MAG: DUF3108 domain-containing protein [Bacteroidetes bacterium]|nr:DUF3108 domain-containing protein [Bacteroidota bacterium]